MEAPEVRATVGRYRRHLARYRALQQIPASTWTDADVAKAMAPHRADAERALFEAGFDRDQVAGLLAEPRLGTRPARTISEHMNRVIRGGRT